MRGLYMELCQRTFISFSKSEIKIEKALQSQIETIIVIQNTIENNRILLTTQNHQGFLTKKHRLYIYIWTCLKPKPFGFDEYCLMSLGLGLSFGIKTD